MTSKYRFKNHGEAVEAMANMEAGASYNVVIFRELCEFSRLGKDYPFQECD